MNEEVKEEVQVKEPEAAKEAAPESPPKDLLDKLGAISALKDIHELLNEGRFEGFKYQRLDKALKFIGTLHQSLIAEAQAHPKSSLIKGLVSPEKKEK